MGVHVVKKLALTFDDGPNNISTPPLLEVLAEEGVLATFFMVGNLVRQRPDIVQSVIQTGHTIGNHTYTHPHLDEKNEQKTIEELRLCDEAFMELGIRAPFFRPPYGAFAAHTKTVSEMLGLIWVQWDIDSFDWVENCTSSMIEDQVHAQLQSGGIILMHDGNFEKMGFDRRASVDATRGIVRRYKQLGFEFVTLTEIDNLPGSPRKARP